MTPVQLSTRNFPYDQLSTRNFPNEKDFDVKTYVDEYIKAKNSRFYGTSFMNQDTLRRSNNKLIYGSNNSYLKNLGDFDEMLN